MPTHKKSISKEGLDGEKLTFQLDIWSGQKKKSVADFSEYRTKRDQVIELSKQGYTNDEISKILNL